MLFGDINPERHGRLGFVGVPQIAFQIEDRTAGDQIGVDCSRGQKLGGTEKGVHRPLCVRRHKNQTARGRRLLAHWRHIEIDAGRPDIMSKYFAQLIVGDLRNQCTLTAQSRCPGERVGPRTATDFPCWSHIAIKRLRPIRIDQGHAALDQLLLVEKFVAGLGDYINNRIADGDNIVTGFGVHKNPFGAVFIVRGALGVCPEAIKQN